MSEHESGWRSAIERRRDRRLATNGDSQHARDSKPLHGWPAVRILLTVILLAFATYTLVLAGFAYQEAAVLRDERALTTGQVEKAVRAKRGDYANVRFTTRDSHTVSAKITAWEDFPAQGDRVTVCYAPRDPDSYAQDARLCPDFAAPLLQGIAGLAALAMLAALWTPWLLHRVLNRQS
ncbi:DUF3592 domain-containing protein [Spirillospora sp. NPDC048911]|uniref:DUF3592 domain-containing protein n=1 Tax=Spirillospora sp. NPDC048911 TaxID=3364527 RepID=UPI0037182517